MTQYLENERNERVWRIVVDFLLFPQFKKLESGGNPEELEEFKQFYKPKLEAFGKLVGVDKIKRWWGPAQMCLALQLPTCVEYARNQILKWKAKLEMRLSQLFPFGPARRWKWICIAVAEAEKKDPGFEFESIWEFLLERLFHFEESGQSSSSTKQDLIRGLACTSNSTRVKLLKEKLEVAPNLHKILLTLPEPERTKLFQNNPPN